MKAKTFTIRLITLVFLSCLSVYIFIMLVDPYQIKGLNFVNKHSGGLSDRILKPTILERMDDDFKMFIIGSSRSMNFKPLMVEQISRYKTFNYSLVNGSLEDYIAAVNHIVHIMNPKIIYLQLDFYTFNEVHSTRNTILNTPLEKYLSQYVDLKKDTKSRDVPVFFDALYFSLSAFIDSYKTIKLYLANRNKDVPPPNVLAEAPTVSLHNDESSSSRDAKNKKVAIRDHYFSAPKNNCNYCSQEQYHYYNYRINEPLVTELLGFIKQIAEENQIKLIIALSPLNKEHLEKIFSDPKLLKNWFRVKEILSHIFPSYNDFNNCSVNAFRGQLYWLDSVHVTTKMAKVMMSVALNQPLINEIPKNFGFKVTPKRLNNYLFNLNNCVANAAK
jgi:hypothetical protein